MNEFLSIRGGMTRAVRVLLIVTVAAFPLQWLADRLFGGMFTALFALHASSLLHGAVWQPVSYLFLHGGLWHLLMNMLALFFFGPDVEREAGTRRFVGLYLGCGILGGLGWVLITALPSQFAVPCVGASGAVFGIMGAFAAIFPYRQVTLLVLFVLPVTMTARTLVIVSGLIAFLALFSESSQVAHAAHLAGGLAGYLYGMRLARLDARGGRAAGGGSWLDSFRSLMGRGRGAGWSLPSAPPSREEVDRILDKVNEQGIHTLTKRERDTLERASRRP